MIHRKLTTPVFITLILWLAQATGGSSSAAQPAPTTVATTQGAPQAGKTCVFGGRFGKSAAIGSVLDGLPDTVGPRGNEVNNIFSISAARKGPPHGYAGHLGFLATTFNDEYFYQFPVPAPGAGTSAPIVVNLGKVAIHPNAAMPTAEWLGLVDRVLALGRARPNSDKAVYDAAERFDTGVDRSGTVTITPCFDGAWEGKTTS